jgi:hypothetical protein
MAAPALPMEPWSRSSMTQERLEELVEEDLLRPVTDTVRPEWIAPGVGVDVPNLPAGYVLSFMAFHERGWGFWRVDSCERCLFGTRWSFTTSIPTPFHRQPSSLSSARDIWVSLPTGTSGSTFLRRSTSLRRLMAEVPKRW